MRELIVLALALTGCTAGSPAALTPTGSVGAAPSEVAASPTVGPTAPATAPPSPVAASPSAAPSPTASGVPTIAHPPTTPGPDASVAPDGTLSLKFAALWTNLIAGDEAVWGVVEGINSRDIVRIDPATNEVTTVVRGLRTGDPHHGMAVGGSLWVSTWQTDAVTRYDPKTGEELATLPVGEDPIEPVLAYGDVWTLNHHDGSVSRIDVETGTVAATISVGNEGEGGPLFMDPGDGLLWVASPNTPTIVAIDPENNRVARTFKLPAKCQPSVAFFRGRLWVGGCDDVFWILDPETGQRVGQTKVGIPGSAFRLEVGDRVWIPGPIGHHGIDRLVAIDADSLEVVGEVWLPSPIEEDLRTTVGFDSLWIYSGRSGQVFRVPAAALPTP